MILTLAMPVDEIAIAPGSAVRLRASWQEYLEVVRSLGEDRSARVAYSDCILEIRMPSQLHESINRGLAAIILTLAEITDRDFNNLGSATLNRPDLARGIEPDSCFYIRSVGAGQGVAEPTSLPPDLAIEVDIASSSERKMAIYAAMGVMELWLYRQGQLVVLRLEGDRYVAVERSLAFPEVSATQLNEWIALRTSGTDLTVIRAVRTALSKSN